MIQQSWQVDVASCAKIDALSHWRRRYVIHFQWRVNDGHYLGSGPLVAVDPLSRTLTPDTTRSRKWTMGAQL